MPIKKSAERKGRAFPHSNGGTAAYVELTLIYANREPRRIQIDDLYLDKSDEMESIEDVLKQLNQLMRGWDETKQDILLHRHPPPRLLAMWGTRQEIVVLESLEIEETLFSNQGECVRARLSVTLLQVEDAPVVTIKFVEDADFSDMPKREN